MYDGKLEYKYLYMHCLVQERTQISYWAGSKLIRIYTTTTAHTHVSIHSNTNTGNKVLCCVVHVGVSNNLYQRCLTSYEWTSINRLSTPTARTRKGTTSSMISEAMMFMYLNNPMEAATATITMKTPNKPRVTLMSTCSRRRRREEKRKMKEMVHSCTCTHGNRWR